MTDRKDSEHILDGSKSDGDSSAPSALNLRAPAHNQPTSKERLRMYSRVSTDEALAALGDPDLGDPRSASATLEMDSVVSPHPDGPPQHRRMKVGVTLSVSTDGRCPPPVTPAPPCQPPEPNPNCPPCRPRPGSSSRWPWIVIPVLVIVLMLLAFNDWGRKGHDTALGIYSGTADKTDTATSSATSATSDKSALQKPGDVDKSPSVVPNSPTALRLDDTVMPANTVLYNQSPNAACDGRYHTLDEMPGFAVDHTQNWVRTSATQWQVRCEQNLSGAVVVALDATHNVINRQIYGTNYVFVNQLTFVQSTDAAGFRTKQVDFYAPFNHFEGRTIYRFDSFDRVSDAYRQDGFQRPLQASHFTRDQNGLITAVDTEKTPRNGGGGSRAFTRSEIEGATRIYYAFDTFN